MKIISTRKKGAKINLLPEKAFSTTLQGRVIVWILSTFRIIVIITEIIVMVAFLSRFWLDAVNNDLDEEIEKRQSHLEALAPFEKEFRLAQKRIDSYKYLRISQDEPTVALKSLEQTIPQDVFLNSIAYNKGQLRITGVSPSEKSIQQFIANLTAKIDNVRLLETGASENSSFITFSIKANFKS